MNTPTMPAFLNGRATQLRTLATSRSRIILSVAAVLLLALAVLVSSGTISNRPAPHTGGSGGGAFATQLPVDPQPPDKSAATTAPATGASPTTAPPAKPAATKPATPAVSAADKAAAATVAYIWDSFVLALKANKGDTALTAAQLKMPQIVHVGKSSCGQPASNVLGPKSRKALTHCKDTLEFVGSEFRTISEPGQLKVVAAAFIYHAADTATNQQRTNAAGKRRTNSQVIGCLQAQLSYALVSYPTISDPAEAWAVMKESSTGGDIHNSYYATYDNNGDWS